ncbi:MAG: 3-isopropylmalate dehydratase small subunit [Gammaproteobacteria bacterium]|nr:3-isopropylmalate dehydratase small subunit [Gammaproteobacteria bacterium]|tara:strand:+ start:1734 stop:2378 length:645 start_codon:yes stop_codon:yes gene_type:complete
MKAFNKHTGLVAPLDRANVDTDQIIPKQFLKSIHRTGFGDNLFDAWRYLDEGDIGLTPNERQINHTFVLNQPEYQGASILLARRNFGCGSSREHAVWALLEYGFRCVIAPSFADIFLNNCFKNGLLPIVLKEEIIDDLFAQVASGQSLELSVDLPGQAVTRPGGELVQFAIEANRKRAMVEGWDDIGMTLSHSAAIRAFETSHAKVMPWLFVDR